MISAYEAARLKLALVGRDDPTTQLLAKSIIDMAALGVIYDSDTLCDLALAEVSVRREAIRTCRAPLVRGDRMQFDQPNRRGRDAQSDHGVLALRASPSR
jgi:hypothetical protein